EAKRRLIDETYALEQEFDARRAELVAPSQVVDSAPTPVLTKTSRLQRLRRNSTQPVGLFSVVLGLGDKLDQHLEERAQRRAPKESSRHNGSGGNRPELSWEQLVERWAAERKPTPKTRMAHRSIAKEFSAIHKWVGSSTRAHALTYKEWL